MGKYLLLLGSLVMIILGIGEMSGFIQLNHLANGLLILCYGIVVLGGTVISKRM